MLESPRRSWWTPPALAVLVAFAFLGAAPGAADARPPGGRLDFALSTLVETLDSEGAAAAADRAEALDIDAGDGWVRVVVEGSGDVDDHHIAATGAVLEFESGDLLQVRAPVGALEALARQPGVELVRQPMRAFPVVTGEGVALTNGDDWHAAGLTGAGVKVAVVDLGFAGYQSKLGTELPASVTAVSFRGDGDITGGGQPHGTAVAEVVHEMAPDAELYLVNFDTEVSLAAAAAYLQAEGVDVVNASWGYFTSGPGDGTGVVNETVSSSVAGGAFWSVSAGNHAARHWAGQFRDTNSNGFHEFSLSPLDEGNEISGSFPGVLAAGDRAIIEMKWDDPYGASCRDYDLFVTRTDDSNNVIIVASSQNVQWEGGCIPGADPVEGLGFQAPVTDAYHVVILEYFSASDANIHVYSVFGNLEYAVAANSVLQPADNASVVTVGAVPHYSPGSIEPFSSRGPTTDGRIKPDIAAPDGVSNATYGNFFGTSAAAPHVAGAAALLVQRLPCYSPAQIGAVLEANVVDLGAAGKDNTFGSGRLSLGAVPPDVDSDGTGDDCDNCPADANPGQENLDGDSLGDACDPDDDGDFFTDTVELGCGSDPADVTPPLSRPERTDSVFAAVDDDGDTQVDEALPPGAEAFDCDGDGYTGAAEAHVFASTNLRDQDACGSDAWPADIIGGAVSGNRLDLQDLVAFIAPVRHLGTNVGDYPGNVRYDVVPGSTFGEHINIIDLTGLSLLTPQMFGGLRAFNGPACPWPP